MRVAALVVVLFLPGILGAQANAEARVDSVFAAWRRTDAPGCAVAVGRNGRTVLRRAYGMADLEHDVPNTPETVFEAGSVSKQFTAAAVVLLARQGKLSLEDDLREYIPEVADYGRPITIRQLMNHTSGLRDWGAVQDIAGWPRGARTHTHAHVLDIMSRQRALNFNPGEEYSYSNTGYNLLAILVDRVSDTTFAEFSRREIFQPLGMTSTQWRDDYTEIVKGRAQAYARRNGAYHLQMPFENVHGNGGLLTTVDDLLTWNQALGSGALGGILRELQTQGRLTDGRQIEYALGLRVARYRGVPEVMHSGSTGGYRAYLARYPDQGLSLAMLCNAAEAAPTPLAHRVADVFLGDAARDTPQAPAIRLSRREAERHAGLFRSLRTGYPMAIVPADSGLRLDDGRPLVPTAPDAYRIGETGIRVERMAGTPARLRVLYTDGETETYEAVEPVPLTAAQLAEYAGDYRSDEAELTVNVSVQEGRLVLGRRPDTKIPLTPSYADAFTTSQGMLVRFVRDGAGRIQTMTLANERVRALPFERVGG